MKSDAEKVIINRFGIPKIEGIQREDLILKTNDKNIPGTYEEDYYCNENSFKFCLVKEVDQAPIEPIFSMDFFKAGTAMQSLRKEAPYIRLELLYVHKDSLRKKGIATYYMNKLVQYAKEEGFTQIKIHPNPNADNFKKDKKENTLNKEQLISFYQRFGDKEIKIVIESF
ncbi:GNAT superfamily N-acetyltransferase [Peribacillus frigoritolerans]|uniref:GNAT family N-acetyltransferase n=1 Tax=Peribacillus frigoritolerans TaxID=450367 RepID=UPI0020A13287|nr:GNAT family N-acetyltransferase [Peribacillus frigoritolerans]MCP1494577.1 GNAT superfamily N-acetyltransferase [Peribacillus frigoritolerans]